jgi:DNA invertase Pin-like site-specific DNA recombinase
MCRTGEASLPRDQLSESQEGRPVIRGYARVSTDGQSVDAQVKQLRAAGAEKVWRETASGAKTDRAQLRRVLDQLDAGDVLIVTRLDRLARSTRDLLNIMATIAEKRGGFRSLSDTWADTTTAHGRLMLSSGAGVSVPTFARPGRHALMRSIQSMS